MRRTIGVRAVVAALALYALASPQMSAAQGTPERLINIGLTTNREHKLSGEGAFSASVMARSGLAPVLYNCQKDVEKTADAWAEKNNLRMLEKKVAPGRLHLAYSSMKPAGDFVLEYGISPSSEKVEVASISLSFRSLENVHLSGDDVGLDPLGQRLLQAVQCVPRP